MNKLNRGGLLKQLRQYIPAASSTYSIKHNDLALTEGAGTDDTDHTGTGSLRSLMVTLDYAYYIALTYWQEIAAAVGLPATLNSAHYLQSFYDLIFATQEDGIHSLAA